MKGLNSSMSLDNQTSRVHSNRKQVWANSCENERRCRTETHKLMMKFIIQLYQLFIFQNIYLISSSSFDSLSTFFFYTFMYPLNFSLGSLFHFFPLYVDFFVFFMWACGVGLNFLIIWKIGMRNDGTPHLETLILVCIIIN